MYYEIFILGVIIFGIMFATGQISFSKLISDNEVIFRKLKESDWDFFVKAKYGNAVNVTTRRKNGYETILCQYNGYELVYVHEYKTNFGYYYLREKTVNYCNSGSREDLLKALEDDVSAMFAEHIDRINKSDKLRRTLEVKSK